MLIKSKYVGVPSLAPNKGVETNSYSQLATGELGGGGGVTPVHLEFSVIGDNTGDFHYEVFEHSKSSEWILVQVYEWDDLNSKRGELVSVDIIPSNAAEIPVGRTSDTDNNVCVKIDKGAVVDSQGAYTTQWYTVVVL